MKFFKIFEVKWAIGINRKDYRVKFKTNKFGYEDLGGFNPWSVRNVLRVGFEGCFRRFSDLGLY